MSTTVDVDPTAYRRPRSTRPAPSNVDIEEHQALRVGLTTGTVYVYPWGERPGTTFAHVDHPTRGLERAHLAPPTLEALLAIAPIAEPVALVRSPSWPIVEGPTPNKN